MTAVTYPDTAISLDDPPKGKRLLRIAVILDLAVCAISFLSFILCSGMVQHLDDLRMAFAALLALDALWLAPIFYFAQRGQTMGLAVVKLQWRDIEGRAARRRLLGEPQFWCAVFPAIVWLLPPPLFALSQITPASDGRLIVLITAACALATLVTSRKRPARLVCRA